MDGTGALALLPPSCHHGRKRAELAARNSQDREGRMIAAIEQGRITGTVHSDRAVASLEGVNKNYGTVRALRGVNFQVHAGEVVALLGPNGAGKTTAVKLLLGLMPPNAGRVRVFGGYPTNPANRMRTGAMLQVGRVPETLRVREHIDLFSNYYQEPMLAEQILAAAGEIARPQVRRAFRGPEATRALCPGHLR